MTQEHLIRPPHELVQQWVSLACENEGYETWQDLATQAARWGADQELQACCEWLVANDWKAVHKHLRAARRPKPLILKEEAKQALGRFFANEHTQASQMTRDFEIIRRAVESLPE